MSDDLSQLDELIESDVLAALGEEPTQAQKEEVSIEDVTDSKIQSNSETIEDSDDDIGVEDIGDIEILPLAEIESALDEQDDDTITMNSNDMGNLAQILSKLLNNKTIEITIKVK